MATTVCLACAQSGSGVEATLSSKIEEIGSTIGAVGIYDFRVFSWACGRANKGSWAKISPTVQGPDTHGIAGLDELVGRIHAIRHLGFGDDTYLVYELLNGSSRAGFEVILICPNDKYSF